MTGAVTMTRTNGWVEADSTAGRLRGIRFDGVESFLGIPYGASTGGVNRFLPPQPVQSWTGTRDALAFGDAPPQVDTRIGSANAARSVQQFMYVKGGHPLDGARMSEDCLNLNVWAPADRDEQLPVMVWFHGGGFQHGSAGSALYNGDRLAAVGDVVVVTVNARLGLTGYLPLDMLDRFSGDFAGAGNAGMLDLVAALEWVRDNIGGFGGDPSNVTIFGQSGGGGKVNTLFAMPSARGLFHRAINMSGPILRLTEREAAAAFADEVLGQSEFRTADTATLRNLPLRRLIELQAAVTPALGGGFGMTVPDSESAPSLGWAPTLDGESVTEHPFDGVAAAGAVGLPLMVGHTSHDPALLMAGSADFARLTDERAAVLADENFGEAGRALLERTAADRPDEPARLRYARVVAQFSFAGAAQEIVKDAAATSEHVYQYEFAQTTDILDGLLGSCHSLDLPYAFARSSPVEWCNEHSSRMSLATQST